MSNLFLKRRHCLVVITPAAQQREDSTTFMAAREPKANLETWSLTALTETRTQAGRSPAVTVPADSEHAGPGLAGVQANADSGPPVTLPAAET